MSPEVEVIGFSATAPPEIISQLNQHLATETVNFENLNKAIIGPPVGVDDLLSEIKTALKEGRYAWARRALDGYPVRKMDELTEKIETKTESKKIKY